jgi:hypothetical protein
MKHELLILNGAHRGAKAFSLKFTDASKPVQFNRPLEIQVYDPCEKRAAEIASIWEGRGFRAKAFQRRAEESADIPATVRILTLDDSATILYLLSRGKQKILQIGLLIASDFPPIGGRVLGIGATLTQVQEPPKEEAKILFSQIAQLTKRRTSSQQMSRPPINRIQMERTRLLLHQELVKDAQTFLREMKISPRLFVVETMAIRPNVYSLTVTPIKDPCALEEQALEIVRELPSSIPASAIVFIDPHKPSLRFIFLTRQAADWLPRFWVEFPTPESHLRAWDVAFQPRVLATD